MKNHFVTTINGIFKTLSSNTNLLILTNKISIGKDNNDLLLELTKDKINTPIGNILPYCSIIRVAFATVLLTLAN